MNMHRESMLLSENRWIQYALFRGVCFSFCLSVFLSFCLFSTGRINLVFDEFVSVSIYGLQSAKLNWFHTQSQRWSKREREIWRERAIHTAANISTKMSVQQNDSTLFESFMSGSAFFFAIALFALCWWSVVLSHSLSLFADFLSFTPRTFTDGLLHSLFDHLLFLVLCFLLNSYSFFLSLPFTHTQTNIFRKKNNDVDGDDP